MGKKIVLKNKTYDVSKMTLEETIKFSVLVSYKGSITEENMYVVHLELIEKYPRNFFNSKPEEKKIENLVEEPEEKEIENLVEEPEEKEIENLVEEPKEKEIENIEDHKVSPFSSPSREEIDYSDRDLELEIENDLEELKEIEYTMELKSMDSSKLKQICKLKGLKKYSKLKKEELIDLILKHDKENRGENRVEENRGENRVEENRGENRVEETEGEERTEDNLNPFGINILKDMNTKKLKELCKSKGLKNYSKLKKDKLIKLLTNVENEIKQEDIVEPEQQDENYLKSLNCSKLKEICKSKGFKKFSKLKKDELIQFILNNGKFVEETELSSDGDEYKDYNRDTLNDMNTEKLKKICKSKGLKKFSRLKKDGLIDLLISSLVEE